MAQIKFTKNELRVQQQQLNQFNAYLPTLQQKRAMLQVVLAETSLEALHLKDHIDQLSKKAHAYSSLLPTIAYFELHAITTPVKISSRTENIAGVEVPIFVEASFDDCLHTFFDTPPWLESVIEDKQEIAKAQACLNTVLEKKLALENELKAVSIRVNLFEKILIPRAHEIIRKIKVFLGDMQLASITQAKMAKHKIITKK